MGAYFSCVLLLLLHGVLLVGSLCVFFLALISFYSLPANAGFTSLCSFVCFTVFYSVFARYDSYYEDDEYGGTSDSGRCVYVTDSLDDANRCWSDWNNDPNGTDTCWFSVRRGCVDAHNTLSDVYQSEAVAAADTFDCAPGAEPPLWWRGNQAYGPQPATRTYGRGTAGLSWVW